ncbi:RNA helicase [Aureococcus anophagefferens]|nr:RNA helicase [Aureococcus anophagefferens]
MASPRDTQSGAPDPPRGLVPAPAAEPTRGDPPVRCRRAALRDVPRGLADALKPHQREGVEFVLARRAAILGDAPGMGKTAQAPRDAGPGRRAATVVPVWLAEFRKFLGTEAPAIVTADGDSRALSVAEVLRRLATTPAPLVAVISYEAMHTGEQSAATRSANRRSLNELDARCMLATVQNLEGVTLIGANFMMLLNPSWNPAQDEQAAMRIHRIGQSRACTVIRLVGRGTIEETIVGRQAEKDGLCAILTQGGFPPPTSPDRTEIFSRSESPSRLHDRGGGDFDELGEDSDDDLAAADASAGPRPPEHHDPSRWSARAASEIPREGRASWLGDLLDAKLRIRETLALSGAAAEGSDGDDDDDDAMVSEDAPLVTTAANTPLVSFVFTSMEQPSAPASSAGAAAPAPAPAPQRWRPRRRTRRSRRRTRRSRRATRRSRRATPRRRWRPRLRAVRRVADDDSDDEDLLGGPRRPRRPRRAAPRRDELLDELMAADAGSTPPPPHAAVHAEPTDEDGAVAELEGATEGVEDHFARAERAVLALLHDDPAFRDAGPADRDKADLVVGLLFQPSIESELDVRRRAADFQDLHHDLRAAIRLAVREASARTTADDERDVLGDGAQTLEHLAVMT